MQVTEWAHAVNSIEALATVADRIASGATGLGVEVDVRAVVRVMDAESAARTVLAHDPVEGAGADRMLLLDAARIIGDAAIKAAPISDAAPVCVLKLDIKDQVAGEGIIADADALAEALGGGVRRVEVWANADLALYDEQDGDVATARKCFPDPTRWGARAARCPLFAVLSVGFHRPAAAMAPYSARDVDAISDTVERCLVGADDTTPASTHAVTLALRLSLFRDDSAAAAHVQGMLQRVGAAAAAAGCSRPPFLTVWRGRAEAITGDDTAWVRSTFPGASVDTA